MPQTKATKRFERKHLKDVLERRKKVKVVKQRKQMQEKKKARRAKENGIDTEGDAETKNQKPKGGDHAFAHMSVDDFFKGGFEIPEGLQTKAEKASAKKKDVAPTTGKRKRTEPREEGEEEVSASASSEEEAIQQPVQPGAASEDDDSEGDDEGHEEQLAALEKKDPEFYKFLQQEEPELLDFNADNFAEIDALSDDDAPAKRRKTDEDSDDEIHGAGTPVTMTLLDKWETHMSEEHSLRATRETVIAFASAVSLNADTQYKYRVSNADGMRTGSSLRPHLYTDTDTSQSTTNYCKSL
jgi:nucleolar complex protein 2